MAKTSENVVPMQQKRSRAETFNVDGWVNVLTAIGLKGRDKRLEAKFERQILTEEECEELWRGDDMAARAVEDGPREIIRAGWSLNIEPDDEDDATPPDPQPGEGRAEDPTMDLGGRTDRARRRRRRDRASDVFPEEEEQTAAEDGKRISEAMHARMDELDVRGAMLKAMFYRRAYGGAAIFLGVKDGADTSKPLDLAKIQSFDFLTVLQRRELEPVRWYADPLKANYGKPALYRLNPENTGPTPRMGQRILIHESRLLVFQGVEVSRRQLRQQKGWGDSVLVRMDGVLRDFHMTWDGAAILLSDFSQAVFKIKGLVEALAANDDDAVIKRAALLDMSRSIARAALIDSEEEFGRETTNVAGLPDLLDRFCNRLAAAVEMPVTRLMGQSPAGLNATGNSDIRWYYDRLGTVREMDLRPQLNKLTRALFAAKNGPTKGNEPDNWEYEFGTFWQLDGVQESDRRLKNAQADAAYVTAGVLTPEEVAASRFGGDKYGEEIKLDAVIREAFDEEADAEAEAEAARLQEELKLKAKTGLPGLPGGRGATTTPPKPSGQ